MYQNRMIEGGRPIVRQTVKGLSLAVAAAICILASPSAVRAQSGETLPNVKATVQPRSIIVPLGAPVHVQFQLENRSSDPLSLTVPGTEPDLPMPEMGLPLSHVFSGGGTKGVTVTTESNQDWNTPLSYRQPKQAPVLMLAPFSMVGTSMDLREFFPSMRSAGQFRITWAPYGGLVEAATAVVRIEPLKRVQINTDEGMMTVEFFYQDAPNTVANFLELASSNFYDGLTFHRLEPGYYLLGGCPRNDGTGIRPDGKRINAEFNSRPHEKGTLSMALLDDDPNSASSQFFICYTRQRDWDDKYTVFGKLVGAESYQVLDRLMQTEVDEYSRPERVLYMRTVQVIDARSEPPFGGMRQP